MSTTSLAAPSQPLDTGLLDLTVNPADRLWRYPLARLFLRAAPRFLTPLHVTVFHTLVGVGAAFLVAHAKPWSLALAFGLYELRSVLDCFDGVLARARKLASPLGRAIDQAGDSISFVAFITGFGYVLAQEHGALYGVAMALLATLATASGTATWDYFRRRFTSLLETGHDEVEAEYVKVLIAHREQGGFARWFARVVATYQFAMLNPGAMKRLGARAAQHRADDALDASEAAVVARLRAQAEADDPALRRALQMVGVTGGDTTYFLLTVSAGIGWMRGGLLAACALTLACVVVTSIVCNKLLSRDAA